MTVVYIDDYNAAYKGMTMCHMIADSTEELLDMVDKIGVKQKYIQDAGTYREHFDICLSKKKVAIRYGAIELSAYELADILDKRPKPRTERIDLTTCDIAQLVIHFEENPEHKGPDEITAKCNEVLYTIPSYCLTSVLWGMPDNFYPCDKYEWADHPLYFTTLDMLRTAIAANPDKFKAFIRY